MIKEEEEKKSFFLFILFHFKNMDSLMLNDEKTTSQMKNYYELLGCDQNSSIEQINVEFKLRALACHPDKNLDNIDSSSIFFIIYRKVVHFLEIMLFFIRIRVKSKF